MTFSYRNFVFFPYIFRQQVEIRYKTKLNWQTMKYCGVTKLADEWVSLKATQWRAINRHDCWDENYHHNHNREIWTPKSSKNSHWIQKRGIPLCSIPSAQLYLGSQNPTLTSKHQSSKSNKWNNKQKVLTYRNYFFNYFPDFVSIRIKNLCLVSEKKTNQ